MIRAIIGTIQGFEARYAREHTDAGDAWEILRLIRGEAQEALKEQQQLLEVVERLQQWVQPPAPERDGLDPEYQADIEFAAGVVAAVTLGSMGEGEGSPTKSYEADRMV